MSLVQLFVPTEVAHDTVAELGELGDVQFKDVGSVVCFHFYTHSVMFQVKPKCQSFSTFVRRRD